MDRIEEWLKNKIGLDVSILPKGTLSDAVKVRMEILGVEGDYTSIFNEKEGWALVELLIVPETWFFRDKSCYEFLTHFIKDLQRDGEKKVHILSLACSSGEEPYSIAMALMDEGVTDFSIEAVDISESVLKKAREGVYFLRSFRGVDPSVIKKYFVPMEEKYALIKEVLKKVEFRKGNIFNPQPKIVKYNVIFCRNVLIYLHDTAKRKLFEVMKRSIASNGVVIVGGGETAIPLQYDMRSIKYPRSFAFIFNKSHHE